MYEGALRNVMHLTMTSQGETVELNSLKGSIHDQVWQSLVIHVPTERPEIDDNSDYFIIPTLVRSAPHG